LHAEDAANLFFGLLFHQQHVTGRGIIADGFAVARPAGIADSHLPNKLRIFLGIRWLGYQIENDVVATEPVVADIRDQQAWLALPPEAADVFPIVVFRTEHVGRAEVAALAVKGEEPCLIARIVVRPEQIAAQHRGGDTTAFVNSFPLERPRHYRRRERSRDARRLRPSTPTTSP